MRSCRLIGSANGGNPGRRLMRRPRAGLVTPAPGRPWPAVRRHYDRLPAVLRNDGLHAAATKERWPPLRIGGLNTGPVAARKYGPKGLQERRINSPDCASLSGCGAPGGASSRSQGMRRRLTASRVASPAAQGASQAPAFPGAPLPLREPRFGLRDEGLPGADQRARAMAHGCLKSESARCARQTFLASRGAREASREG